LSGSRVRRRYNRVVTPFRDAAASPTRAALERLDAMPVHPLRRACAFYISYREVGTSKADTKDVGAAEALGFKQLGCAAEGVLPRSYRKQIFVDDARTTQAHLSAHEPGRATRYFLVTYFESGKCIITWDHRPATRSSDVLRSRATAGSFDADYTAHVAAVKELAQTDVPIVVTDLPAAVALGRFYYRHVVSLDAAATMVFWPPVVVLIVVISIVAMLMRSRLVVP